MTYTIVPIDINEDLTVSQPKITANFAEINTIISVDHETFNAAPGQGKHKQVTLTEQAGDPANLADQMILYTKNNGNESALYVRKEGAAGTVMGLLTATRNLEVRYGSGVLSAGNSLQLFLFAPGTTDFPNQCLTILVCNTADITAVADPRDQIITASPVDRTSYRVYRSNNYKTFDASFRYIALGY